MSTAKKEEKASQAVQEVRKYRQEGRKSKLGGTGSGEITAGKREKAIQAVKRRFRTRKKLHILRCTAYRAGKGT